MKKIFKYLIPIVGLLLIQKNKPKWDDKTDYFVMIYQIIITALVTILAIVSFFLVLI